MVKLNLRYSGKDIFVHRPVRIPLNAGLSSTSPASLQRNTAEGAAPHGVMPWGVFAAYAAALAGTGFLFVMALSGGIHLG